MLGFSLHAKLIAALCGKKDVRMWIGSANATARGWSGRNVECVVEVPGGDTGVYGVPFVSRAGVSER